jgi:integral membrane protein (TIGR01906 family)
MIDMRRAAAVPSTVMSDDAVDPARDADPGDRLDNADPAEDNGDVAVAGRQRGTHMGFVRSLATIIFVVALPLAILTTNIRLLLNAPLVYSYSFDRYNAEEVSGISREDLDGAGAAFREYFNNDEKTYYYSVTENGLPGSLLNARETRHMENVKQLVVWVNRIQIASVMYIVAYGIIFFVWSREGNVRQLAAQCLAGILVGALSIGAIGVAALINFEWAFERFHLIAFPDGLWRLDPRTDHLIQMFPEPFWRDATYVLGAMTLVEALLLTAVAGIYLISTRGERRLLAGSLSVGASTQAA